MKEYNAKIFVDNDNFNIIYECDKELNVQCKGRCNCRECKHTSDSRYARAINHDNDNIYHKVMRRLENLKGKNVSDKEAIVILENEINYYRNKIQRIEKRQDDCPEIPIGFRY